jgi:hypothetical protein
MSIIGCAAAGGISHLAYLAVTRAGPRRPPADTRKGSLYFPARKQRLAFGLASTCRMIYARHGNAKSLPRDYPLPGSNSRRETDESRRRQAWRRAYGRYGRAWTRRT